MFRSILSRPLILKLTFAGLMAARLLGETTDARASEPAGGEAPQTPPAQPNALFAVRAALREFDRFLDHHPVLEGRLRLDPSLTSSQDFLEKSAGLRDFLGANPHVVEGLRIYPRYYLNRALLRQASAPLPFHQLAPLKDLFLQQPILEQELTRNPELIRDPVFLESHPALRDCLVQHPALARVFLSPSVTQIK